MDKVKRTDAEWRELLTPEEYAVLREAATEAPFTGEYTDAKTEGVYRCRACGAELFRSDAKFESHCGWPSFYQPSESDAVVLIEDRTLGTTRTEVRCAACDSHLGHVFTGEGYDVPTDERWCINSVSLQLEPPEGFWGFWDDGAVSLRLIPAASLSSSTAQTGGMVRSAAISGDLVGARELWMGRTVVLPGTSSGDHHHGSSETGIYVVSGNPVFVFRDPDSGSLVRLETSPGDYVWVPPHVPHREENPSPDTDAVVVIARSTQEAIVVNVPSL